MKIIAINGSARKNWNTHLLLESALDGARAAGAETELVHLYDLSYKGCTGCLTCKIKNGKSLGRCAVNDDLKPVLDRIDESDGIILGSPIYLGDITAMTRAFLERLVFQYLSYDDYTQNYFAGKLKAAFLYAMNVSEGMLEQIGYDRIWSTYKAMLGRYFTYTETLLSTETLQVNDYGKYHMSQFPEADRKQRRETVFPEDCKKAYVLGQRMVKA